MIRCDELMSIFLKNKNVVPERGASLFFLASPETAGHRFKHVSKKNSGFQNFIFFQKKTAAHTLKQSDIDLFLHILAIN